MGWKYILDGKVPVKCEDLMTWANWYETNYQNRHVADETIDGVRISTVFLGLDHSFYNGPPLLFETMIFGGAHNDYQDRCSTWEEAEAMHARASDKVMMEFLKHDG